MNPVFIVDDESSIRETMREILSDEGYTSVLCGGEKEFFEALKSQTPSLVLLDIWLPGANGMEILQKFKSSYEKIPVIMMSGHAGIETAVASIKLGAYDFLEKPISLNTLLEKIKSALPAASRNGKPESASDMNMESAALHDPAAADAGAVIIKTSGTKQKTLAKDVVLNGTGLLSGKDTGMIISPLPPDSGIVFQSLDGRSMKGIITSLENFKPAISTGTFTASSTVLANGSMRIRTVEHLMAALHMYGITNALIKADEEIPNIDGSGIDFADLIEEAGISGQDASAKEAVIQKKISVGTEKQDQKYITAEPYDGFEITMRIHYPGLIGEQVLTFNAGEHSFRDFIAPARSFNTLQNIDLAQQMGRAGKGFLNSHIILHEGKVINTELRFPDEFVRHKILDLIGDLYLLGCSVKGRFTANMTSHGYNQALVQKMYTIAGLSD